MSIFVNNHIYDTHSALVTIQQNAQYISVERVLLLINYTVKLKFKEKFFVKKTENEIYSNFFNLVSMF